MANQPTAAVVGAGIVGVCCALYLQNEGFNVTLIDRGGPGEEASFGNLGGFGVASCPPAAMPGILAKVPNMLLDADAPLKLRWSHAIRALPWFLQFTANARRERVEANAAARQSLLDKAHEAVDPLIAEAGAQHLMSHTGLMFTFESEQSFRAASYAFDLRRRNGVRMDLLDGDEARQVQPALSPAVVRAWRVSDFWHTLDPLRLVQALAALFERRGGRLDTRTVSGFDIGPDGVRALRTAEGDLPVRIVVVAAGVWSRRLAAMLGTRVPLEAERGYHAMFRDTDVSMNGGIISVDRHVAVTPMAAGVRVGGVAEFAPPEAPPDPRIAARVRHHGEALFPRLKGGRVTEWVGPRPSHPDSRPVIGRSPRFANVLFAFGHDHLGLTMGGITGRLISELAVARPPSVDLAPFRPDRF
ncbi:MAG: FAD-dependent oxidoreductase [Alphaproteobacteria bacterium]|nr:FAD-dependent oxidoreductase [Alphaproteobacteria bacterium]MCY4318763.1 FAD-dependent oxidoreductase [Alphaproteobacteria bacterium]